MIEIIGKISSNFVYRSFFNRLDKFLGQMNTLIITPFYGGFLPNIGFKCSQESQIVRRADETTEIDW